MKRMKRLISGLIAFAMIATAGIPAIATTDTTVIYVSANSGSDDYEGTLAAPLKTIDAARAKAREIEGDVTVEIMGGEYILTNAIAFTEEDSNVTYKAYNGEKPVIKASKSIDRSAAQLVTEENTDAAIYAKMTDGAKNNTYVIDLASQGITQAMIMDPARANTQYGVVYGYDFNSLYIDGVMQTVAQWPNNRDYAEFTSVNSENSIVYSEDYCDRWADSTGWWVGLWMPYDFSYFKFSAVSVDTENNILTYVENPATTYEKYLYSKRWKAYNLIEEMDVPGEYYIDRDNLKLYYYSPSVLENQTIELDRNMRYMITIEGAENILFDGLTFAQTNSSVFSVIDVVNVDIKNCVFKDIGYNAIGYSGSELCTTGTYYTDSDGNQVEHWQKQKKNGSYDVDISGNIFNNIGSTAINLNGGGDNDTLTPSRNVIKNNIISNVGYKSVHPVISIGGCGVTVRNNNISKATIGAIYVSGGNEHLIEKNEIYNVIEEASDWGVFYEGGSDIFRGTMVQYNYIHDIVLDDNKEYAGLKLGRVGIYFDENQQELAAEHNILKNIPIGFNSNHAGNFQYKYNTAVDCTSDIVLHDHPTEPGETVKTAALGLTLSQVEELAADNQLFYTEYPTLGEYIETAQNPMLWTVIEENLRIGSGQRIGSQANAYSTFLNNQEITDYTVFVDADAQDYRLKADSDIAANMPNVLNENNFEIEEIGIQNDFTLNETTAGFENIFPKKGTSLEYQEEYNFSWQPALGANEYKLTIATDKNFENVVFEKETKQTAAVVTGLSDESIYYYKVEAKNISRELSNTWLSNDGVSQFGINVLMYEDTPNPEKPANLAEGDDAGGSNGGSWTGQYISDEMKEGATYPLKIALSADRTEGVESNWFATGIFVADKEKAASYVQGDNASTKAFLPESNKTYVFSVNAKSPEGNVKVGIANINTWGNYVVGSHGREGVQIGTDWTEFKTTLTTADTSAYRFNYLTFGIVTGKASDYIVYDANTMYLAEEIPYSIDISGDSRIAVGETKTYSAELLNQIGLKGALPQDFEWVATNTERTEIVDAIEIVENEDGTISVTGAEAGTYTIIATSKSSGITKGANIKVVENYNDTVTPEMPTNMVTLGANGEGAGIGSCDSNWYGGNGSSTCVVEDGHTGKATLWKSTADHSINTWYGAGPFYINSSTATGMQAIEGGKTYLFSIWAKDVSDETVTAPMLFTAAFGSGGSTGGIKYANEYPKGTYATLGKEWTEFTATYTFPEDYAGSKSLYIGYPTGIQAYTGQAFIVDDFYFVEEIAYSMNISGDTNMMVGESKTYSAELFNQNGEKGHLSQDFEWMVVNEERTSEVEGIEITQNEDGTITAMGVKPGKYVIVALSEKEEFLKGVEVTVSSTEDTETPEKPANLIDVYDVAGQNAHWSGQNIPETLTEGASYPYKISIASDRLEGEDDNYYASGIFLKDKDSSGTTASEKAFKPAANTDYVFSAKLRSVEGNVKVGLANIKYWSKQYVRANHPAEGVQIGTDWTEFKTTLSTVDNSAYEFNYIMFGIVTGAASDYVLYDAPDMYLAEEIAYSLNIDGDKRMLVGDSKTYSAELLNQIGTVGTLSQDFKWIAMDENRENIADGIEVTENEDGTVTVEGIEAGKYTLLAVSETEDFIKGININVLSDYNDTETPEKPANMVTVGANGEGGGIGACDANWYGGNGSSTCVVDGGHTGKATLWKSTADHTINTWYGAGPFYISSSLATGMQEIEGGKDYVFSIWAKDVSDETVTAPMLFTAAFGTGGSTGGIKYANEYPKGTYETLAKDWTEYTATYSFPLGYAGSKSLYVGYPANNVQAYEGLAFLVDDFYFAEEIEYSMNITGDATIEAGQSKTYSAEVLNQVGKKGALSQDFDWLALNADRSEIADGIVITENEDGTASVEAIEAGTYTILAIAAGGFMKGYTVTVGGEVAEPEENIASAVFEQTGTSVNFKATVENVEAENIFFVIAEFNSSSLVQEAKSVVKAAADPTCDLTLEGVTAGNTVRAFIWNNGTLLPIDNADNLALEYTVIE